MPATPIFLFDKPTNSVEALRRSISNRLVYQIGKDLRSATQRDWLFAVFYAVRDRIMDGWRESLAQAEQQDAKRVYYLSLEFLTGRALTNAMMATGVYEAVKQACALLGADFDALMDLEPENTFVRWTIEQGHQQDHDQDHCGDDDRADDLAIAREEFEHLKE